MTLAPWGDLTIFAAVMEIGFATCVFVYIGDGVAAGESAMIRCGASLSTGTSELGLLAT